MEKIPQRRSKDKEKKEKGLMRKAFEGKRTLKECSNQCQGCGESEDESLAEHRRHESEVTKGA